MKLLVSPPASSLRPPPRTPAPTSSSASSLEDTIFDLVNEKREAELNISSPANHPKARASIKDKKCPKYGRGDKKDYIERAIEAENAEADPDPYYNFERIFDTGDYVYKVSLDDESVPGDMSRLSFWQTEKLEDAARAVFSRKRSKNNYNYKGLSEHELGLSDIP